MGKKKKQGRNYGGRLGGMLGDLDIAAIKRRNQEEDQMYESSSGDDEAENNNASSAQASLGSAPAPTTVDDAPPGMEAPPGMADGKLIVCVVW